MHVRHCGRMRCSPLLADLAWRRPRRILAAAIVARGRRRRSSVRRTPSQLSASDNDYQDKGSESYRTFQLLSQRTGSCPARRSSSSRPVPTAAGPRRCFGATRRSRSCSRAPPRAGVRRARRVPPERQAPPAAPRAALERDAARARRRPRRRERAGAAAVGARPLSRRADRVPAPAPARHLDLPRRRRGAPAGARPGVLSIVTTLAMLRLANSAVTISVFALNLVTGAGLGLAIDYSLLLLSRYREELVRHGPGAQALRTTVATAGRTVAFSAVTVAAAFASLLVFPLAFLRSMAIGGCCRAARGARRAARASRALRAARPAVNALAPAVAARGRARRATRRARRLVPLRALRDAEAAADRRRVRRRCSSRSACRSSACASSASTRPCCRRARARGRSRTRLPRALPSGRDVADPCCRDRRRPRRDARGDPASAGDRHGPAAEAARRAALDRRRDPARPAMTASAKQLVRSIRALPARRSRAGRRGTSTRRRASCATCPSRSALLALDDLRAALRRHTVAGAAAEGARDERAQPVGGVRRPRAGLPGRAARGRCSTTAARGRSS